MGSPGLLIQISDLRSLSNLVLRVYTGLFKKKYTLSIFFKTTGAIFVSCVRMERKFLKVLIWISRQMPTVQEIILSAKGSYAECGKSWIIDLTSAVSHVGLTSNACKVWK
jgi:hypothetical protein